MPQNHNSVGTGTRPQKYRFLFAMEMSEGNATVFENLKHVISNYSEVESYWLPINPTPKELKTKKIPTSFYEIIARMPPVSLSWSLQRALYASAKIHELESRGVRFNSAFFNTPQVSFFLKDFRRRVPSLDSMDCTGEQLRAHRKLYNYQPVAENVAFIKKLRRKLILRTYHEAKFLLPWSSWAGESLVSDYSIPSEKVKVVPPGIDLDVWTFSDRRHKTAPANLSQVHVLFVGGNFTRKGGNLVLELARLPEFSKCDFHLVTKAALETTEKNVFVYNNLTANCPKLRLLYEQADIFILPTRADFFSLASMEAMANGLPVIVSNVGGIADIIKNGENGYLIQANDDNSFREALRRLVESRELRLQMGMNARSWIEQKFDLKKTAQLIFELMISAAEHHQKVFKGYETGHGGTYGL